MIKIKIIILFLLAVISLNSFGDTAYSVPKPNITVYQYRETKDLVRFVYEAAIEINELGEKSFPLFRKPNSKWFKGDKFIFVYNLNGVSYVHPFDRSHENQFGLIFFDAEGKCPVSLLNQAVADIKKPYGWVHYLAARPNTIFPVWKTSFAMKVEGPSGKEYVVGSGIYNMRIEKDFIEKTVNAAVELISKHGESAFQEITRTSSRFVYSNISLFVINSKGSLVVDPVFPQEKNRGRTKRNILNVVDSMGNYPIRKLIKKLTTRPAAWVMYMTPKPGQSTSSKMLLYAKKVSVKNRNYIVGSGIFAENPIWMKE